MIYLPYLQIVIVKFSIKAANFLDIKGLLDVTCKTVANMIKGKSPEEIRRTFNIKNDFTPEEEEQVFIFVEKSLCYPRNNFFLWIYIFFRFEKKMRGAKIEYFGIDSMDLII